MTNAVGKYTFWASLYLSWNCYVFHKNARWSSPVSLSLENGVEAVLVKRLKRRVSKRRNTIVELPNQNTRGVLNNNRMYFSWIAELNARCFKAKQLNNTILLVTVLI